MFDTFDLDPAIVRDGPSSYHSLLPLAYMPYQNSVHNSSKVLNNTGILLIHLTIFIVNRMLQISRPCNCARWPVVVTLPFASCLLIFFMLIFVLWRYFLSDHDYFRERLWVVIVTLQLCDVKEDGWCRW